MKKMNVYIVFYLVIAVFLISASMYNAGSPGKKTGSPLDGASCTQCHSGTPAEAELITSNIPETGYVPGQTYNITLTASNADAQKFGFEITSENNSEKTGTFAITESNRTKLTNNNKAVTHTSGGTAPTNGSISWSFDWTAPETNAGEITFYAAVNAANGNSSTSGDQILTGLLTATPSTTNIPETNINQSIKIYPNPATSYVTIESFDKIYNVALVNSNGKALHYQKFFPGNKVQFQFPETSPGMHIVQVNSEKNSYSFPIQIKP